MAVSREEVRRIAALARLRLEAGEEERFAGELSRILEHVEALAELDLEGVPEARGMAEGPAPERAPDGEPDALVRNPGDSAPAWHEGFFAVPRLEAMEGESGERSP